MSLRDLITNKDIFQNPDFLSEIFKHYDYLSLDGRVHLVKSLKHILISQGITDESEQKGIITDVMRSIAAYYKDLYSITVLKDSGEISPGNSFNCEFSILYSKSGSVPTLDKQELIDFLSDEISEDDTDNIRYISSLFDNTAWIWNIGDIAGTIRARIGNQWGGFSDMKFVIYSYGLDVHKFMVFSNNILIREIWSKDGRLNSYGDIPAVTAYMVHEGGETTMRAQIWYKDDVKHRDNNSPAGRYYDTKGKLEEEIWYINGKVSNPNNYPADIVYQKNDKPKMKVWIVNEEIHRDIGPAIIEYDEDNRIIREEWYTNNVLVNEIRY